MGPIWVNECDCTFSILRKLRNTFDISNFSYHKLLQTISTVSCQDFRSFPFLSHLIDNLWSISRQQSDKTYDLCLFELISYENNSLPLFKNTHIFTVLTQNGQTQTARLQFEPFKRQTVTRFAVLGHHGENVRIFE